MVQPTQIIVYLINLPAVIYLLLCLMLQNDC